MLVLVCIGILAPTACVLWFMNQALAFLYLAVKFGAAPVRAGWKIEALCARQPLLVGLGFGPMPPYSAQEAKALGMAWPAAFLTCFALGMMAMRGLLALTGMGRRPVALMIPWVTV